MITQKIIIEEVKKITQPLIDDLTKLSSDLYENKKFSNRICKKWLELLLKQPNSHLFVARLNSSPKIIGMLTLISYPTIGGYQKTWIEDVVVDPDARGKGAGKKLVTTALKKVKQLKIKQVNLTSNPSRIVANKMYRKLNFTRYNTNYYHYIFNK